MSIKDVKKTYTTWRNIWSIEDCEEVPKSNVIWFNSGVYDNLFDADLNKKHLLKKQDIEGCELSKSIWSYL